MYRQTHFNVKLILSISNNWVMMVVINGVAATLLEQVSVPVELRPHLH